MRDHAPIPIGTGVSAFYRRRRLLGVAFAWLCGFATLVGVAALVVLLADVLADGLGRLDVGFLTSFASRFPERAGVRAALAGSVWLLGQGLKRVFERPRPYEADAEGTRLLIGTPRASSWPSSHPAVLLAFVEAAGREARLRPAARVALTGLAGAVGVSRVVVGVHYPADVAGGLLLGRAVAEGVARNGR